MITNDQQLHTTRCQDPNSYKDYYLVAFESSRHEFWVQWYKAKSGGRQSLIRQLLCKQPCLTIGTLELQTQLVMQDPEAQDVYRAYFQAIEASDLLTEAFKRPELLAASPKLFSEHLTLHSGGTRFRPGSRVLVIALKLDKISIVCVVLLGAIFSFLASVAAAVGTRDVELGAAVGWAMFAFIALIQGAIVWRYS